MNEQQAEELLSLQRETNRWLRVMALPSILEALAETVTTSEGRRIYQASEGGTSREVGSAAGVTHPTVLRHWSRWAPVGLVEEVADGRFRRIVDLDAIGFSID